MRFLLSLSLFAFTLTAFANYIDYAGSFAASHDIADMTYENESACIADEGRWEDGLCYFAVEDTVVITRKGADSFEVEVDTISTNAHMCSFTGMAKVVNGTTLLAKSAEEEINEGGEMGPATCELKIEFLDGATINVTNNGAFGCKSWCGARAWLDVFEAKRK